MGIVREPGGRGTSGVETVTKQRLLKTQQAGKNVCCSELPSRN
jgi:hypothetical protein